MDDISIDDQDEKDNIDNKTKTARTQIRHLRKFAAHVLLGGWDILRNLNVIRNQLQCIFGYFKEETKSLDKEFESTQNNNIKNYKYKWKIWRKLISKCNHELKNDLNNSKARKLMELHHEDQLSMKHDEQGIFARLIDTILNHAKVYDESKDTIIDGFNNESFSDLKLDDDDNDNDDNDDDDDDELSQLSGASSLAQDSDQLRYYVAFKQSWRRVPDWWFDQHDKLLLELALKFNWDKNKYKAELIHPSKKQYYQVLLTKKDGLYDNDNDDDGALSEYSLSLQDDDIDDDENNMNNNNNINKYDEYNEYEEEEEDYIGYQEFQVWCENWRNIQHRLRYLTFVICDYFYKCSPSMVAIRIPDERHRIEQYKSKSIVFLNGYIEHVHLLNCKNEEIDLNNIQEANVKLKKIADDMGLQQYNSNTPSILPIRGNLTSKQSKSSQWSHVLNDPRARKAIHGNSSKRIGINKMNRNRIRDPFMFRNLDFELEQICQSFDLLEYGIEIATFLIVLLKRKQLDALWSALGIVLEYMPYEYARHILEEYQEDLRHGQPEQLKCVCDRIIRGSNFSVHICLFLAEYMENNSKADLARYHQWMRYSKSYEQSAGATINTIESNHLLAVLLDIPLTYSGGTKVSLLQVALEQNRAEFLNNERINAVMAHVWQSPSGLAPDTEIMQKNDCYADIFWMLFDTPYHFYLTPMGFNCCIKTLHLLYLCAIFAFIAQRIYLDSEIKIYEWFLWSLNIGYILYECIEAYDKGIRGYLSLAGWVNWWDISICCIWIILFIIRMISWFNQYHETYDKYDIDDAFWGLSQSYMMLWAIQTASLSARSLVLFQTSEYFGVLLRMLLQLMAEMMKFMFVLGLLLVGFVFGLYYIQGGYDQLHESSIIDWYEGFKYLFQLTVGAGDFSEIEDIANEVTAQLFVIGYLIISAILMMNLLIALLTTTYELVHNSAKTASSFAFAESTYDLSHRSRFMPAPICIYIFVLAVIIHILNVIPALIWPKKLNIYNCINHYQYQGFDAWRMTVNGCLNCRKIFECIKSWFICNECRKKLVTKQNTHERLKYAPSHNLIDSISDFTKSDQRKERKKRERCFLCCICCDTYNIDNDLNATMVDLKVNENKKDNDNDDKNNNSSSKTYQLTTRGRVWKYYASTFCCCDKKFSCITDLKPHRFEIYHNGCYSCIPTSLGAKEKIKERSLVNGITLNEYAELYEQYHQFNLDQADIVLLKHLTVNSLFCTYCYRPFDPKSLNQVLLTPFWALSEIISIYSFPWLLWLPLCIIYGMLTLLEMLQNCLNQEREIEDVDDYDRQYFAREALNIQNKKKRNNINKEMDGNDSSSSSDDDD